MKEEVKQTKLDSKSDNDNSVKITVAKAVADDLGELVEKVNTGFEVGRIHRQDVASWIITQFLRTYTDHEVGLIRQSQYTDALMLEAVYRRMRETGDMPDFLKEALRKQFHGEPEIPKKKKVLTNKSINDGLEKYEDAA
ncbi:MAG: hypothetical protein B7Y39_09915 [Bdellovibrio sp. 28-41-41]|nr:MAG: hypothetical protein B7Y39_09915 [Bdellovibrio sp. 28-41-41]